MSVRNIISYYSYNSERYPLLIFIDDTLADTIRPLAANTRLVYDGGLDFNLNHFMTVCENYLGNCSALALPYNAGASAQSIENLLTCFPNSFPINNGVTGSSFYGETELSAVAYDNQHARINFDPNINYRITPISLATQLGESEAGYFNFTVLILKESEVADGKFNIVYDGRKCYGLKFIYATTTSRIVVYTFGGSSDMSKASMESLNNKEIVIPTPSNNDPYDPNGDGSGYSGGGSASTGGTGGGPNPGGTGATGTGGLHDDSSDAIPTPSLPSSISTGSGLFTAYNPDASQLAYFADKLWNLQPTDINDVLRFLFGGDAFNAIIGLHLLPVQPDTSGSINIMLGNWDSGAPAPKITNQYKQVPFGSIMLPEYWGNCIDYAPYTKIQLALPYIGIVDVDTDDVLGSNNTLTYNIDVLSGAICAILHCVKGNLNSVIYQWSGTCAVSLPFSGASYNSVLSAIAGIGAAGMGFAALAAGPIGAALPASALAAGAGAFGAGSAASILGSMKGKTQKSGAFGANSGALGIMTPYFILTRPVQSVPATWQADKGYPANISAQLGTLTGYTEVSEINLECSGTEAEKKEIIDLLKKGVLF